MSSIKRGDIYYIESYKSESVGSEQRPGRPAVVVSNDRNNANSTVLEVVYLTTQPKHDLPTHVTIRSTDRESIALCEQITPVSFERFGTYKGHVTDSEMANINIALAISLGLSTCTEAKADEEVERSEPPPPSLIQGWLKSRLDARCFSRCTMPC